MDQLLTQPVLSVLLLVGVSLLPFVFMLATSFIKITVVFSILRSGLGTQQVPSGLVISAVAALLSLYVMRPVGQQMHVAAAPALAQVALDENLTGDNLDKLLEAGSAGVQPLQDFLFRNAGETELDLFVELAQERTLAATALDPSSGQSPPASSEQVQATDLMVAFPAFVITELSEAFQIGFVIFLPFLIIDVVVSNILLALGMHMLSPTTISLPFKLLLFVMVDGWYLLSKALVLGYQ